MNTFLIVLLMVIGVVPTTGIILANAISDELALSKINYKDGKTYRSLSVEDEEIEVPTEKDLSVFVKLDYELLSFDEFSKEDDIETIEKHNLT